MRSFNKGGVCGCIRVCQKMSDAKDATEKKPVVDEDWEKNVSAVNNIKCMNEQRQLLNATMDAKFDVTEQRFMAAIDERIDAATSKILSAVKETTNAEKSKVPKVEKDKSSGWNTGDLFMEGITLGALTVFLVMRYMH